MALVQLLKNPITLIFVGIGFFVYWVMIAPLTANAITTTIKSSQQSTVVSTYISVELVEDGAIIPVVTGTNIDHALKHGAEVVTHVENCIKNNHSDLAYSKENNKRVELCLLPEGGVAIRVSALKNGVWQRITSFINDNVKCIEDAVAFAENDMGCGNDGYFTYLKDCWKEMFPNIKY